MRYAVLIVGLLVGMSALAGDKERAIKGVWLNQPIDELHEDNIKSGRSMSCEYSTCKFYDTIGGVNGEFTVVVKNEHVNMLDIVVDANDFESLAAALLKKFGKPSTNKTATAQNALGAKFDDHIYVWFGRGWQLQAKKRSSDSVFKSSAQLFIPEPVNPKNKDDI